MIDIHSDQTIVFTHLVHGNIYRIFIVIDHISLNVFFPRLRIKLDILFLKLKQLTGLKDPVTHHVVEVYFGHLAVSYILASGDALFSVLCTVF